MAGMSTHEDEVAAIFAELKKPFFPHQIDWRVSREVRNGEGVAVLAYLTARAVMDRLDEACGPDQWTSELNPVAGRGFICELSLRMPTGEWVHRSDVCDESDIEGFKGAASGALKRAAVLFGVGRYLYDLPDMFADLKASKAGMRNPRWHKGKFWDTPEMPHEFLPSGYGQAPKGSRLPDEIKFDPNVSDPFEPATTVAAAVKKNFPNATLQDDTLEHDELIAALILELRRRGMSFKGQPATVAKLKAALHAHFGTEDWSTITSLTNKALRGGLVSLRTEPNPNG